MAEGLTGSLAQLPLRDILTMLGAGGQSGRLELSAANAHGDVYLRKGAVVHAVSGVRTGEGALGELLTWTGGAFRFQPQVLSPETSIDKPLEQLFSEGARQASEREAVHRIIPSGDVVPHLSREAPGSPVTLQPHEWQIIALADGRNSISDMAAIMRAEDFAFMQTVAPLVTSGLLELEVVAKVQPIKATVGAPFWQALTAAVAAAMGPLAEIIIDDAVADMGSARETFPREMVSALAERIAGEIRDTDKRVRFQQNMLSLLRSQPAA